MQRPAPVVAVEMARADAVARRWAVERPEAVVPSAAEEGERRAAVDRREVVPQGLEA
jgi:hypothetical protein